MKVFLSWSGQRSHQVATVLKEWLPSVIQSIDPFVSSEDISKGERWSIQIAKELEETAFGILCVTKDNFDAPWLMFEAGALSKIIDKTFLCPFLFDLKMADVDKKSPILQFQTTIFEKEDIRKLVKALNSACGEIQLADDKLQKAFEIWWPSLEESLNKFLNVPTEQKVQQKKSSEKDGMLEEVLELARVNQKILRSPEDLFPQDYFESIISKYISRGKSSVDKQILVRRLNQIFMQASMMRKMLENDVEKDELKTKLMNHIMSIHNLTVYIKEELMEV